MPAGNGAHRDRWIVVADSPFVPPRGGGQREHAGFVDAAVRAGLVSVLVVPHGPDNKPGPRHRSGSVEIPVVPVPRDFRRRHLVGYRTPFVVASRPVPDWVVPTVARLSPDATAVIVFSYKSHAIGRRLAEDLELPAVLRQHNLEGHYHRELARGTGGPRGWMLRWEAYRIERDERGLEHCAWLRAIADISCTDAEIRSLRARMPVHYVPPFAISIEHGDVGRAPRPGTVLFLGSLNLATNHDSLWWFVDDIWPRVRQLAPGSRLVVVGSRPSPRLLRHLSTVPCVDVHADVPDVAPYLRAAAVAINPTVSGSGVNIKLVEYVIAGIPTVTTSVAAAGLQLRPGVDVEVADEPEAFARALVGMINDPDRTELLAAERARHARRMFAPERSLERLRALLR